MQPTPETPPDDLARPDAATTEPSVSPADKTTPYGRVYLILTVVYLVVAVYGSLVPLDFRHIPFDRAVEKFVRAFVPPPERQSQTDVIVNLLLFIPLTFLAMGAITREHRRRGKLPIAFAVAAAACTLSLAIEFTQLYLPLRTTSRSDVIAETIGGLAGILMWFSSGPRLTRWMRSAWHDRTGDHLAARILAGYVIFIVLGLLFPFDLTITPADVWHKVKSGQITAVPFSNLGQEWAYAAMSHAALMAPVGYLLYLLRRRRHPGRLAAVALGGMAFSALIELMQVFTVSQDAATTNVIYGTLGALAGGLVGVFFGPAARYPAFGSRFWDRWATAVKLAATGAWVAGALVEKWRPFDFARPHDGLAGALREIFSTPFTREYGLAQFHVGVYMTREFAMSFIMAMFLRGLLSPSTRGRRVACTVLAVAIAAGIELAQICLPTRTASLTTIVIASLAAVLGTRAMPGFVNVFLKPHSSSSRPEDLPS